MIPKITKRFLALLILGFVSCISLFGKQIILDTDGLRPWSDIDDLGAIAVLHSLANEGLCDIRAIMLDHRHTEAIRAVDAVNHYFNRGGIPIGHNDGSTYYFGYGHPDKITEQFFYDVDADSAPNATSLYREILASSDNNSITIVTVGTLLNIENLLRSGADNFSSLNGRDLFNQKVDKIFIMGGNYPSTSLPYIESNFKNSEECGAQYVVNNISRPIVFNGFEIGSDQFGYATGTDLNSLSNDNPIKVGYLDWFQNPPDWANYAQSNRIEDWSIWDQIAVHTAVKGTGSWFNEVNNGFNDVKCSGENNWNTSSDRNHTYLTQEMDPTTFADSVIEPRMKTLPQTTVTESISLSNASISIPNSGSYTFSVNYATNQTRKIQISVHDSSWNWKGDARITNINGSGTINITVNYSAIGTSSANLILRLVESDGGWWDDNDLVAASYPSVSVSSSNNTAKTYTIQCRWGENYLRNPSDSPWTALEVNTYRNDSSIEWEIIPIEEGRYRIKSKRGSNNFISGNNTSGVNITTGTLNEDWWSQQWYLEEESPNIYRLRCRWGDLYMHGSNTPGNSVSMFRDEPSWWSQQWILTEL